MNFSDTGAYQVSSLGCRFVVIGVLMRKIKTFGESLNAGERAIAAAPRVRLKNGQSCIPQHYLKYAHNRESVEALISRISFSEKYPIFVSEDESSLFIQIGIIGYDNYKTVDKQTGPKIVFGRRWRVEPNLPSSEIIQTVFLAIKKAREHEIRELFTLSAHGKTTTPFNNHHDLPLMARNHDILKTQSDIEQTASLDTALSYVRFDGGRFHIQDVETLRNGREALTLSYIPKKSVEHQELTQEPLMVLLKSRHANALYHGLIEALITASDRFVDETFTYNKFARFSHDIDVTAIAELSIELRQEPQNLRRTDGQDYGFSKRFKTERYDTDMTRIPTLTRSRYNQNLYETLDKMQLTNINMLRDAQK